MYKTGLAVFALIFIWSGIQPKDYLTWTLEVFPAVIGISALIATRQRFPLTPLAYFLIFLHAAVLSIGGHYTYAEVPLFESFKQLFGFTRNHYDKLGHFMQGFEPALVSREIFLRNEVFRSRGWLNFMIVCFCLALSAIYELIEWWAAVLSKDGAEAFLGTQGYVWDTQSDMAFALVGAVIAVMMLSRLHDRQLRAFI